MTLSELLSVEFLLKIHDQIAENSQVEPGTLNEGLLSSIAEAPDIMYNGISMYTSIHQKAAVLMEHIIRLHPFIDGNKRTSLFAMLEYLDINGFTMLLPLDAVRRTVLVAQNISQDVKSNQRLTNDLAEWIRKYCVRKNAPLLQKMKLLTRWVLKHIPLYLFRKLRMRKTLAKYVSRWLAFDIYPEYAKSAHIILLLSLQSMLRSLRDLTHVK